MILLRRSGPVSNATEAFGDDTGVQPIPQLKQEPPRLPKCRSVIKCIPLSTKRYPRIFACRDSNLLVLIKRKRDSEAGREDAGWS